MRQGNYGCYVLTPMSIVHLPLACSLQESLGAICEDGCPPTIFVLGVTYFILNRPFISFVSRLISFICERFVLKSTSASFSHVVSMHILKTPSSPP